jgi:outer membrane protein
MKKVVLIVALAFACTFSIQAQKLGHTNIQDLLMVLPERAEAETQIQNLAKTLESRLSTMTAEYQTKVQQYQTDQATMSNTIKESEARSIMELEQRISEFQQNAQQEIQQKENDLLTPMINKLTKAIEDVGKNNNFTYIFDTSSGSVLYKGGEDVTPLVKTQLGL